MRSTNRSNPSRQTASPCGRPAPKQTVHLGPPSWSWQRTSRSAACKRSARRGKRTYKIPVGRARGESRGGDEFPSREHRCTGGEELVDQAIMEIGVEVGAAVLNDRQTEIGVGCF